MKPQHTYHSNGKLLITGEYLVLLGAKALAVPSVFGQSMHITKIDKPLLNWQSIDEKGEVWFQDTFDLPLNDVKKKDVIATTLMAVFKQTQKLNPDFLTGNQGFKITTKLDFPRDWGLGSSSTFINNLAQWAQVDAFNLLKDSLGGSGYDIACAQNNVPILYQLQKEKPIIKEALFNPEPYKENLYFIHLNKKQYSDQEVRNFKKHKKNYQKEIAAIDEITQLILRVNKLKDFEILLKEHESIMSRVLQRETVQDSLFSDYFGQIKSLGAWGGDFILATGNDDTPAYFKKKGLNTILLYDEMILKQN